jgi:hypothetical protein
MGITAIHEGYEEAVAEHEAVLEEDHDAHARFVARLNNVLHLHCLHEDVLEEEHNYTGKHYAHVIVAHV